MEAIDRDEPNFLSNISYTVSDDCILAKPTFAAPHLLPERKFFLGQTKNSLGQIFWISPVCVSDDVLVEARTSEAIAISLACIITLDANVAMALET